MQRWRGLDAAPPGWGRCVVTIGVFDGVHRGHQAIIGEAVARGRAAGVPSVVLTFDPHPSEVVRPGTHPPVLTSPRYKAALIEDVGADVLCVLGFTPEFSRLTPAEFAHVVLVEHLHAVAAVVGENFRFGHKAAGDVAELARIGERFGFAATGVPLVRDGETTISSTYVRACVDAGDVAAATRALGREHRVEGVVVRGDARGRTLGYPTANLRTPPHTAVPADGVYAAWLVRGGARLPAAVSIGTNPTFEGRERRVEAYVLDFAEDIYGDSVALDFVALLRAADTMTFDSVDALVAQIGRDVANVRELLAP
ncbi:MAG TPA: bifunctional riboflavin kinase/FAD synthetase [Frankiaceae bacterium]|nr:bifunctional riboflavin kinase/FAD synthetase [Frankiaceae bacterium]